MLSFIFSWPESISPYSQLQRRKIFEYGSSFHSPRQNAVKPAKRSGKTVHRIISILYRKCQDCRLPNHQFFGSLRFLIYSVTEYPHNMLKPLWKWKGKMCTCSATLFTVISSVIQDSIKRTASLIASTHSMSAHPLLKFSITERFSSCPTYSAFFCPTTKNAEMVPAFQFPPSGKFSVKRRKPVHSRYFIRRA